MRSALLGLVCLMALDASQPGVARGNTSTEEVLAAIPERVYTIVERAAHDRTLFTQGLAINDGLLLESGGNYRESRLLLRRLTDPRPLRTRNLPAQWFAEGITVHGGELYLLTWREGILQRFSLPELEPGDRLGYRGEGWGLTSDGTHLIHSDGSAMLRWRQPEDFTELRQLQVHAGAIPLEYLNELEWVDGWLFANVWQSDSVVAIDPRSGCALWRLALGGLLDTRERSRADVLNGIAWDADSGLLWVTGKFWPWLFALRVDMPPLPAPMAADGRCDNGTR